jgi:phage-related minor tail protein
VNEQDDIKQVLGSMVLLLESLAKETADLVDDSAGRIDRPYVDAVRQRASELRSASSDMRKVADKVLHKTDLKTGGQS